MRIILDSLYANQLIGIFTTFAASLGIVGILYLVQRFTFNLKKHPIIGYLLWLIYIFSGLLFIIFFIQISFNPFSIGRAGSIHQAAILKDTIVFVDIYAQSGAEFGDTPDMIRLWVLDRQTGKLVARKKVNSYELLVAANDSSLLIQEDYDWYITNNKFETIDTLIKNSEYNGKKVHRCTFNDGKLNLSFKDFSEFQLNVPFSNNIAKSQNSVQLKFLDTDHETYQITCCDEQKTSWKRDQSIGKLLGYTPEIIYESPTNDLYLLWTQNKLVALSKHTGKTIWSFWY